MPRRRRRPRPATPGAKIGLGPLSGAYDAVGRWLVDNPAPQWLVNSPLKTKVTELLAGTLDADFNLEASETRVRELVASDDVVVFSATYCPFSAAAKAALRAEGVRSPPSSGTRLQAAPAAPRSPRHRPSSIPPVFIGGVSVGGCNDGDPGIRPLIKQGGLDAALERCSEETRAARRAPRARETMTNDRRRNDARGGRWRAGGSGRERRFVACETCSVSRIRYRE